MKTLKTILSLALVATFAFKSIAFAAEDPLPIADAHIHYSHDSVEMTPPERVIEIMREAGLKFALVSSSDDRGTQLLSDLAPDLIVPGLRPYTRRGETGTWFNDAENLAYVEQLLQDNRYATIGEFHLYGESADLPVPQRIVELADQYNLILHAHSDADAVARLLAQSPTVKVIWAHSGFDEPHDIARMLEQHDRLWADLAFRSDVGSGGALTDEWISLFHDYPDRMMLGTDTYTPERMYFIPEHAANARTWLASLPPAIAEAVAWKNAYDLIMPVWQTNRVQKSMGVSCDSDAEFVLQDEDFKVNIQTMNNIAVSQPFAVQLTVCGDDVQNAQVTLDATMPTHGHGMNYAPSHTVLTQDNNSQQLQVDGLVLHMPGSWQWSVDLKAGEVRKTLTQDFTVR